MPVGRRKGTDYAAGAAIADSTIRSRRDASHTTRRARRPIRRLSRREGHEPAATGKRHGGATSRYNPRNQFIAAGLQAGEIGTVLIDLLTPAEERADQFRGRLRFDIRFLARRVTAAVDGLREYTRLPLGLLGASTGAAAALVVPLPKVAPPEEKPDEDAAW